MDLAQGYTALEANCRRGLPRREARHAINAVRAFANSVPAALGVGDVACDPTSVDMLNEHDRTRNSLTIGVDHLSTEVRREFTRVRREWQEQQEGEEERFH